jgi:hypothetical protein
MLQVVAEAAPAALPQLLGALQRAFAAKAAGGAAKRGSSGSGSAVAVVKKDWKAVQLPKEMVGSIPITTLPGQAFVGDLRSTSGLGLGDGKTTHTSKWLTVRASSCHCHAQGHPPAGRAPPRQRTALQPFLYCSSSSTHQALAPHRPACQAASLASPACVLPPAPLQEGAKSPMDYIQETEPIKVSGMVVASTGSELLPMACGRDARPASVFLLLAAARAATVNACC